MADINEEQTTMTFTGHFHLNTNTIHIFLSLHFNAANDEREYHNAIDDENDMARHPLLANEESRPAKIENPQATAKIEDTKDSAQELARRIPWGYFLAHPASRTLLFAYWVMSWIGTY
jgi:hypothetical protein